MLSLLKSINETNVVYAMNMALGAQGLFTFCFFTAACLVANTANMGVNVVLTAVAYSVQVAAGWEVINRIQSSLTVGILMGVSICMALLSMITAIFWDSLAGCDTKYDQIVPQYSCRDVSRYDAVCVFAALLCIFQSIFCALLFLWKDLIVDNTSIRGYDALSIDGTATDDI